MTEFIADMRKQFDTIIIDSPPVFGLSDPLIMLPCADATIMVVKFGQSLRKAIRSTVERLASGDTPILGVIMNDVPIHRRRGYYYYGRYYGYNYRYYGKYGGYYGEKDA